MTSKDSHEELVVRPDPSKSKWALFRAEFGEELYELLRQEVSNSDHGHGEVLVSLPVVLPKTIKLRRWLSTKRTYGPISLFWWPYRYPAGMLREALLELATALFMCGAGLGGWAWWSLPISTFLWWQVTLAAATLMLLGLGGALSLAGGIENWGESIDVPLTDTFRETFPDPVPLVDPAAPGPLLGWSWGEQVRKATCPLCEASRTPGGHRQSEASIRAFYEGYSVFPPVEWNWGFWRYWGGGHMPQAGKPTSPTQRGPRLEGLLDRGLGGNPWAETYVPHERLRDEAWLTRGPAYARRTLRGAQERRVAKRQARAARRSRFWHGPDGPTPGRWRSRNGLRCA